MLFWKSFSKRLTAKIISLKKILHSFDQFPCKLYPILDQNSSISIPNPRAKCLKPLPFTAAHTYIAYIWEFPPPPGRKPLDPDRVYMKCEGEGGPEKEFR